MYGRNPFVNQVSFFYNDLPGDGAWTSVSQSLRKSGQFLYDAWWDDHGDYIGRNPFVNQVSFFLEFKAWEKRYKKFRSQSLRKSGQFLSQS